MAGCSNIISVKDPKLQSFDSLYIALLSKLKKTKIQKQKKKKKRAYCKNKKGTAPYQKEK